MHRSNDYLIQFGLLLLLIVSIGGATAIALSLIGYTSPDPASPLGASPSFIAYNNLIKTLLAFVVITFYRMRMRKRKVITSNTVLEYVFLSMMLYFLHGLVQFFIDSFLGQLNWIQILFGSWPGFLFRLNIVIAGLVVYHWTMKREFREMENLTRQLEISQLKEAKSKAELEALHSKVNPHFLYNSLNSIHSLIDMEPARAKEMVHLLSKLFRLSVNNNGNFFWTIEKEIELVSTYLTMEKIRLGDRLNIQINCADDLRRFYIPQFIVQPLVENSIKHGISRIEGRGFVSLEIVQDNDGVIISVRDNGLPFKEDLLPGYGLRSVKEKVAHCGSGSFFEIISSPTNECVKLKLVSHESHHY